MLRLLSILSLESILKLEKKALYVTEAFVKSIKDLDSAESRRILDLYTSKHLKKNIFIDINGLMGILLYGIIEVSNIMLNMDMGTQLELCTD